MTFQISRTQKTELKREKHVMQLLEIHTLLYQDYMPSSLHPWKCIPQN